mmetsp:Transcript_14290/g.31330  ORF Transcript_14290/g.31330 Transcript_14290/m.31330 type:complete len:458 (+) Transcript_14290:166-1539(+)
MLSVLSPRPRLLALAEGGGLPSSPSSAAGRTRPLLLARICDSSPSTSSPGRVLPLDRARSWPGPGGTSSAAAGKASPPSAAPGLVLPRLRARSCDSRSCIRTSTSSLRVRLAVAAALLSLRRPLAGLYEEIGDLTSPSESRSLSAPNLPPALSPPVDRRGTIALAMSWSLSSLRTLRSSPLSLLREYSLSIVLTLSSSVSCCCSIMTRCSSTFSSRSFVLRARRRSASSSWRLAISRSDLVDLTSASSSSLRSISFPSTCSYSSILPLDSRSSDSSDSIDFVFDLALSRSNLRSRAARFSSSRLPSSFSRALLFSDSTALARSSHSLSCPSRAEFFDACSSILVSYFFEIVFFSRSSMSILTLKRRFACSSSLTWLISSSSSFSNSSDITICSSCRLMSFCSSRSWSYSSFIVSLSLSSSSYLSLSALSFLSMSLILLACSLPEYRPLLASAAARSN